MAEGLRMVHLRTVPDSWHAKVLAARLGAEGIVTHLSGAVAGPYPFGAVSVYTEEGQAELAAALLLADEVESAFAERSDGSWRDFGSDDILPAPSRRRGRGGDDIQVFLQPGDDVDLRAFEPWADEDTAVEDHQHGKTVSRKRRAMAAFAALVVAGAPFLAHFVGQ